METGSASASIPEDLGELSERVPLCVCVCVCKRGGKEGRREGGKKRRRGGWEEGRREDQRRLQTLVTVIAVAKSPHESSSTTRFITQTKPSLSLSLSLPHLTASLSSAKIRSS